MFGYVTANIKSLSEGDAARYKACYCGLCHELGHRYGKLSRVILSYDLVFLILVRTAYLHAGTAPKLLLERCAVHPKKPHYFWVNEETAYAADMSIILAYYQALDDWKDEKHVMALGQFKLLKKTFTQVVQHYPVVSSEIEKGLADLTAIERSGILNADEAARCFGRVMAAVFGGEKENEKLKQLGMTLGQWIYIMDACVDRREDLKKKRYNPLPALPASSFETVLRCLMANCVQAYEALQLEQDRPIFENILYSGVWTRFEAWKKSSGLTAERREHEGPV